MSGRVGPLPAPVVWAPQPRQALFLARRMVNAASFPIAREISGEIRDKVDEYLFRKEAKK